MHPYLQLSLPLLDYFRRPLWIWFPSVSVIAVFLNANISSTWALPITWSFSWIYSLPPRFLLPPWNASHNSPSLSSLHDCGSASEVSGSFVRTTRLIATHQTFPWAWLCADSQDYSPGWISWRQVLCVLFHGAFAYAMFSLCRAFCPPYRASFENALPFTCQHPYLF